MLAMSSVWEYMVDIINHTSMVREGQRMSFFNCLCGGDLKDRVVRGEVEGLFSRGEV